jgi:predicted dehydrogenase
MSPVRIGVLGAARIAPAALIRPAGHVTDAEVVAVAARDRQRAQAFAAKHGIPRVLSS